MGTLSSKRVDKSETMFFKHFKHAVKTYDFNCSFLQFFFKLFWIFLKKFEDSNGRSTLTVHLQPQMGHRLKRIDSRNSKMSMEKS